MIITTGTRVLHTRYPWMVGKIVSGTDDAYVSVVWDHTPGFDCVENLSELRATPVQPNPNAFSDHIHDTVATAYGHSSTERCNSV